MAETKTTSKKYNIEALKNPETSKTFELKLSNRFLPLLTCDLDDVEEFSEAINTSILETANLIIPPLKHSKPHWMTNETTTAIENKKSIRKKTWRFILPIQNR